MYGLKAPEVIPILLTVWWQEEDAVPDLGARWGKGRQRPSSLSSRGTGLQMREQRKQLTGLASGKEGHYLSVRHVHILGVFFP